MNVFLPKTLFQDDLSHEIEKYFLAKFVRESLDFHFFAPPLAHKGNLYFGLLGETYSKEKTLLISIEKIQNLCLNSSSECVVSKTFRPCAKIPIRSQVIVETVTKGHFSTRFLSDYCS